jgi:hypothetical protein
MARDEGLGGSLCLFHGSLTELPLPLPAQEGGADAAALPQSTALPQSLPPLSSPRVADRRRTEGRSPSPRPSSAAASPGVVVVAGAGAGASAAGAVTPKRLQTKLNAALYRLHCREAELAAAGAQLATAKRLAAQRFELSNRVQMLEVSTRVLTLRLESLPAVVQLLSTVPVAEVLGAALEDSAAEAAAAAASSASELQRDRGEPRGVEHALARLAEAPASAVGRAHAMARGTAQHLHALRQRQRAEVRRLWARHAAAFASSAAPRGTSSGK